MIKKKTNRKYPHIRLGKPQTISLRTYSIRNLRKYKVNQIFDLGLNIKRPSDDDLRGIYSI